MWAIYKFGKIHVSYIQVPEDTCELYTSSGRYIWVITSSGRYMWAIYKFRKMRLSYIEVPQDKCELYTSSGRYVRAIYKFRKRRVSYIQVSEGTCELYTSSGRYVWAIYKFLKVRVSYNKDIPLCPGHPRNYTHVSISNPFPSLSLIFVDSYIWSYCTVHKYSVKVPCVSDPNALSTAFRRM